jgi:hypothetical protein
MITGRAGTTAPSDPVANGLARRPRMNQAAILFSLPFSLSPAPKLPR